MSNATITHVFLTSLGHSGSTILNIALGAVDGGLSLGEVEATVRMMGKQQHTCTCGAEVADCPVWAPLFSDPAVQPEAGTQGGKPQGGAAKLSAAYARLYQTAADLQTPPPASGGRRFLIDSSKRRYALGSVPAGAVAEVKVILLVKDPRNYFVSHYRKWIVGRDSRKNAQNTTQKLSRKKGTPRSFPGEIVEALRSWVYGNHKILRDIRRHGYSYMILSYEEMVLQTELAEKRLSSFLGVPVSLTDFSSAPDQQHILRGNAMRHDPDRSSRLVYDYRWFYDPWVRRLGFVFAPMISWAKRVGLLGEASHE